MLNLKNKNQNKVKEFKNEATKNILKTETKLNDKQAKRVKKKKEKNVLKEDYPIVSTYSNNMGLLIKGFVVMSGFFLLTLMGLYWMMSNKIDNIESKVFVVSDSKAYSAELLSESENRSVIDKAEVVNHLKTFTHNMFSYNKVNFEDRVTTALELVNPSDGRVLYDALKKANTKERLISTGQSTEVRIDSINVALESGTNDIFKGNIYYLVDTYYGDNSVTDGHRISCYLRKTKRSVNNPHGLLIENVNYYSYEPE